MTAAASTMRAYELTRYTGPDGLRMVEVPAPSPTSEELLVRVEAIGINFPDLLMTKGEYQHRPELPCTPGCEIAGTVLVAPPDSGWLSGDRVAAFIWSGGFAEQVLVPVQAAARIPADVDHIVAASIGVNYQTVMFALDRRARLTAGETVLVLGAAGGIGSAAVQVAKALGARVLAGVAGAEQIDVARRAGADQVITLEQGYGANVIKVEGHGVDIVVDPLGDWLFEEALRCLKPEGRIIVLGFAAGAIPKVTVNRLLLRNISVVGAAYGAFIEREPELAGLQAERLFQFIDQGSIAPVLEDPHPFDALPAQLERLARGEVRGKAVVTLT